MPRIDRRPFRGVSPEGGGSGDVASVNGQTGIVVLDAQDVLPDQTGQTGKYLSTNGSVALWENVSGGSGGYLSTIFVAANDSSAADKAMADYVCDGTDDQSEINDAIADVAAGGKVQLASGSYSNRIKSDDRCNFE
jgi:hypothetical protein